MGTWECKEIGWRLLGLLHWLDEVGGRQRWPSMQDGIYDEEEEEEEERDTSLAGACRPELENIIARE